MNGMVYLLGAGCGGRELLTIGAQALLRKCDTVIYDALIDGEILLEAPFAEKIPVGKRAGKHSESQERINELLIQKALEGKNIVRLKGGDPFVFGRGSEEAEALEEKGIPYTVVPGVSSCIAAPELAGIPVTHRNVSRSFHVITAHTADGITDVSKYAKLDGTLVFLMGLSNIAELTKQLTDNGMGTDTPAAVISKAGSSEQRTIRGTLFDISEKVSSAQLEAPAVIVIGKTAAFEVNERADLPLVGVSVTVTGTERFVNKISESLKSLGAFVHRAAILHIEMTDDTSLLDDALLKLSNYSWLVFTSREGAEIFFTRMRDLFIDLRTLYGVKLAAVGSSTAEHIRSHGLIPELVSDGNSRSLALDIVAEDKDKGNVLLMRAKRGSHELTSILAEKGLPYDDLRIYDVKGESLCGVIDTDYIVFGSPSGAECFFVNGTLSDRTTVVCIGKLTAETVKRYSANRYIIAHDSTGAGIIHAIMEDIK